MGDAVRHADVRIPGRSRGAEVSAVMVRLLMETSTGDGLASCWNKHGWQVQSKGSREKTTGAGFATAGACWRRV